METNIRLKVIFIDPIAEKLVKKYPELKHMTCKNTFHRRNRLAAI
ncbi:hypothetical protein Curi_c14850 [Gottschalkia acidurici 9a]|uniref:Uncharacterized protein n=1 Tax=Gottschalkia acidurici (strain ATCC 7906 / DSM 604 / BCRC 14475 / CIP 104303 / KCTC 5404 / NCIMB 10678 / 9a) TaxID=1128398 RepID=K0B0Q9_GOTA9|nr:hypothetical protein Curi_c14850 [Gottschalkia acidurici 9a]